MKRIKGMKNALKKDSKKKKEKREVISNDRLLRSGATVIDLGCTGRLKGAFPKGKFIHLVGDSESGKTFVTMTCLAEAILNPNFKDYDFFYEDPEDGASMDKTEYFGKEVQEKIQYLKGGKDPNNCSKTLDDFYDAYDTVLDSGKPSITILDSENALQLRSERKRIAKNKAARNSGNEKEAGSMGTERAKLHSARLNVIRNKLRDTGSIFIMISQAKTTMGFGAMFNPKTHAGGLALKFFADLQLWTSIKKRLKKKVNGKDREIGMIAHVKISKNRINGKKRRADVIFYNDYGIDDIGSNIHFLLEEKHWKKSKKGIDAKEWDVQLPVDELIRHIEKKGLEFDLKKIVRDVWNGIEEELSMKRKPRYG